MPTADLAAPLKDLVVRGGELARQIRPRMTREFKPDGSVVTSGDREVELFLRTELETLVPGASVWGEEFGFGEDTGGGLWLIDPIDGTTNYSFGSPLWGVSVAFMKGGVIELGAVALPDLGEVYVGVRGHGARMNGVALSPIPSGPVQRHEIVGYCEAVAKLKLSVPGKQRCSGAVVVEGVWVASQTLRGLVGVREHLYDIAACLVICQEVGADIRYADGQPLDLAPLAAGKRIQRPWIMFPGESGFMG